MRDKLLAVLITITVSLASFSLGWQFKMNAVIAVQDQKISQIILDKQKDLEQDKQLKKFWRYHAWEFGELNKLRQKQGLPLLDWPQFGD